MRYTSWAFLKAALEDQILGFSDNVGRDDELTIFLSGTVFTSPSLLRRWTPALHIELKIVLTPTGTLTDHTLPV